MYTPYRTTDLYCCRMGDHIKIGVQETRERLRERIDAALERDERTVITRSARPVAVLVPYAWYAEQVGLTQMEETL